jgi:hypothetical protein
MTFEKKKVWRLLHPRHSRHRARVQRRVSTSILAAGSDSLTPRNVKEKWPITFSDLCIW